MKIDSPCTGYCLLEQGSCVSCLRTRDEIGSWMRLTPEERAKITKSLTERRNHSSENK